VIGIDPNPEMLAEARAASRGDDGIEYQTGEAVATGVAPASVDLVTAAQAFHWFDVEAALAEFRRILVSGGHCAAFWNVRDENGSPFLVEYDALLRKYSDEYDALAKAPGETLARIQASPAVREARETDFHHVQRYSREGLFGRAYSSSYVVHGVTAEAKPIFDAALDELFDRHESGGEVEFPYRTRVIAFQIAASISG
jgi:SAM-dependent methyltransferase